MPRNLLLLALVWTLFAAGCGAETQAAPSELPLGVWTKLHEQRAGEGVTFRRQPHGGSCFDTRRGLLVLFGSDTHGKDWTNSPLCFDPLTRTWTREYPDDAFETYRVTEAGVPVCGPKGAHPWASHTFGAVVYDSQRGEMAVACFDTHLEPGRFTSVFKDLWPQIKLQPTWFFSSETKAWSMLPKGVSFFPHCACWDSDRNAVLGYRADGFYELAGEPRAWKKVAPAVPPLTGWHTNAAYDAKQKAMLVFGHHQNSNDIVAFFPAKAEARLMPTPGARPPKDQHNPMEFHPGIGKTVVLIDKTIKKDGAEKDTTETWLYDLGADAWTPVESATLPFACGMNYNLEYAPNLGALLLVTSNPATTVWALKLAE